MLVLDSPNITIGCEVRVMRDNGGAGVRAHKEYREVCLSCSYKKETVYQTGHMCELLFKCTILLSFSSNAGKKA